MKTTRQKIRTYLENSLDGATPSELSVAFGISESVVRNHVEHIAESTDVLVRPPSCRSCGFDNFDRSDPTSCPECRSEWLDEPVYTIES